MKNSLLLLMSLLPIFSFARTLKITKEERSHLEQESESLDNTLRERKITLIGKQFESIFENTYDTRMSDCGYFGVVNRTVLFFDTDGDTNTTEVVAAKYCPCLLTEAKIFDAKIGDAKTSLEWRDALEHKNENKCYGPKNTMASRHRLVWGHVRSLPISSSAHTSKITNKVKRKITKEERRQEEENKSIDRELKDLTLIGKQFEIIFENPDFDMSEACTRRTVFFFDTDGDTNTTEVVAAKHCPCLLSEAKIFDAKIGDSKTSLEWQEALKHRDEDRCDKWSGWGKSKHKLVWDLGRQ